MKTNLELRQIRDFGQIISDTLVFIKQNFKPLFKSIIIICGFFFVTTMVTNVLMDSTTLAMVNSAKNINTFPQRPEPFDIFNTDYFLRLFFLMTSMALSYISVYLTTYCYIVLYREKGNLPPTVEEVWAYFKFYFFRILGSGILLGIIITLSMVLCLSGIYLIPAFALFLPIMVIENASFSYAFSRSFKLISNYWWQTFGVIFVVGLIVFFISAFLTAPGQILLMIQMLVTVKKVGMPITIFSGILKSLVLFAYTLPAIANCICYFSLVEVKEGTGLLDRIDMLGKTDTHDNITAEEY